MKIGLLVGLPLAMWLFIDLLVPTAISAAVNPVSLDFRDYLGPILGTVFNTVGRVFGFTPETARDLLIWSPLIFGLMMAFTIPLVIIIGLRASIKFLASGIELHLADETVHTLYVFLFFLALFLMIGLPASIYLVNIDFPFALLLFAITTIAYMIGVLGLITRGG